MDNLSIYYKTVLSATQGTFETECTNCLVSLVHHLVTSRDKLVKITLFIDSESEVEFYHRKDLIDTYLYDTFQPYLPTYSLISQAPGEDRKVVIEAGFVSGSVAVMYRKFNDLPYVVLQGKHFQEVWISGVGNSNKGTNTNESAVAVFEEMQRILENENVTFDQVIRQWNFIGEILKTNPCSDGLIQNYQSFNEIRHFFYHRNKKLAGFPAATGIGKSYEGLIVDLVAVKPLEEVLVCPVKSPVQKNPYEYGQEVLVGKSPLPHTTKRPPEFERALITTVGGFSRLYVSGTASIAGQETVGAGDVEKQTRTTVAMIQSLISAENLQRYFPLKKTSQLNPLLVRVYVKRKDDMEVVRTICQKAYGEAPITIVQADICRENLLVEIEMELSIT